MTNEERVVQLKEKIARINPQLSAAEARLHLIARLSIIVVFGVLPVGLLLWTLLQS